MSWLLQGRPVLKLSQRIALSLFILDHPQLVTCEAANVKCLAAWSDQNSVVAFRGTANFINPGICYCGYRGEWRLTPLINF